MTDSLLLRQIDAVRPGTRIWMRNTDFPRIRTSVEPTRDKTLNDKGEFAVRVRPDGTRIPICLAAKADELLGAIGQGGYVRIYLQGQDEHPLTHSEFKLRDEHVLTIWVGD